MAHVRDWRWWVVGFCIVAGLFGVAAVGYFVGQWGMSVERSNWKAERTDWSKERAQYIKRFPEVRAETRNTCVAEYEGKVQQLQKQNDLSAQALIDLKKQMEDTHDLAAYTLRFLGDRAVLADKRNAAMLRQTKVAADAAVDAKETVEKVDKKVNVAVVKADEAASAVKSVDKKLETATHPTAAVPPTPWVGSRR